jgi:adenylate cyclase
MVGAIADWNGERAAAGETPVLIGIGVHFGPVVVGDTGDEHRLECAVIGDTVNIASPVENLTRDLGVTLIARDGLMAGSARKAAQMTCTAA